MPLTECMNCLEMMNGSCRVCVAGKPDMTLTKWTQAGTTLK